jgi:dethiobiotin synthetase
MAAESGQSDEEIAPYRYGPPASPHLAATMAGEQIEPERLCEAARAAAAGADVLVCEGVGGLLVPLVGRVSRPMREELDPAYLVRDLAVDLGYPLVIVASPGLGTINHTLLTIESARAAGLEVATVVLTPWPPEPTEIEQSNLETIATHGEVEVRALPQLDLTAPATWPPLQVPMGLFRDR